MPRQQLADIHLQHLRDLEQDIQRRLYLIGAPARDRALAPADLLSQPDTGLFLLDQYSFDAIVTGTHIANVDKMRDFRAFQRLFVLKCFF